MEPCACGHEQQVLILKSRMSNLEMMLDKAHKRINTLTQSTLSSPASSSRPSAIRTTSHSDIKQSDEYKRVVADLESERKIKIDLLANLKGMTTASEATQARLEQELTEVKTRHEIVLSEMEEIQESFNGMCLTHGFDPSEIKVESGKQGDSVLSTSATHDTDSQVNPDGDTRISGSIVRSFAMRMDRIQEQRTRNLLLNLGRRCPVDLHKSLDESDNDTLEAQLLECIDSMTAGYVDNRSAEELQEVIRKCHGEISTTNNTNARALTKTLTVSVDNRLRQLDTAMDALINIAYRFVPTMIEDLFSLLSRSSSFTWPEKPSSPDNISTETYESYLRSMGVSLAHTIRKYISSHQRSRQKISYRGFSAGDLGLFLPTRNANSPAWAAFNVGAPHYFLCMDGVDTEGKDFLIGRIQDITEKSGEPGVESPSSFAGMSEVRKWWEVKILEKKKVNPA